MDGGLPGFTGLASAGSNARHSVIARQHTNRVPFMREKIRCAAGYVMACSQ